MNIGIHHINIEATKICNQRCSYCFNDSGPKQKGTVLRADQWEALLSRAEKNGLKSIHLTGGEPFLHKDIIAIINMCVGLGLKTSILSNGFRIAEMSKTHPETFQKLELAQISLDSLKAEKVNKRRGNKNAYQDAISAIVALRTLDVPVEISSVIDDENEQDIESLVNFAEDQGCRLILRPLIKNGRSNVQYSLKKNALLDRDFIDLEDKFQYVLEGNIQVDAALKQGFLTVNPVADVSSSSLNQVGITNLEQLLNVA